jgi:hypothetical protein
MNPYYQQFTFETDLLRSEYRSTTLLPIEYRAALLSANPYYGYGYGGYAYGTLPPPFYPYAPFGFTTGYPPRNPYFWNYGCRRY